MISKLSSQVHLGGRLHHFVVAPVVHLLLLLVGAGVVAPLILVVLSPILGILRARLDRGDNNTLP